MKKILIGVAIGASMLMASPALADCSDPSTPCGNGDPSAVVQAWGLTAYQSKHLKPGQTINTVWGLDTCPKWYFFGCMIDPKLVR